MREAVKSLAPRERDLIRKIFFQEMEKDEVCDQLGVSRDYLRVLLHRAIEHLREVLEDKDFPPKAREPEKKKGETVYLPPALFIGRRTWIIQTQYGCKLLKNMSLANSRRPFATSLRRTTLTAPSVR